MPDLQAVFAELAPRGLVVVGALTGDRTVDLAAVDLARSTGAQYPLIRATRYLERAVGVGALIPTSYLYDASGVLRRTYLGAVAVDELRADIAPLLR